MPRLHMRGHYEPRAMCGARGTRLSWDHRRVDCERCLRILTNIGQEAEGRMRALEGERR